MAQRDYAACNVFDVTDRLGGIAAPALVVCGDHDQMTPLKYSEYLAANIPGAELVIVEGAGHMLPSEFPGALADILGGWLGRTFGDA